MTEYEERRIAMVESQLRPNEIADRALLTVMRKLPREIFLPEPLRGLAYRDEDMEGHCQSKFVYFANPSEADFPAIDFPAFFRVDLSGSMAAPSI